jgi:hypothetical protein
MNKIKIQRMKWKLIKYLRKQEIKQDQEMINMKKQMIIKMKIMNNKKMKEFHIWI